VDLFDRAGVKAAVVAARIAVDLRDEKAGTSTPKDHDVLVHELFEHRVEPELEKSDRPVFV
jgi:hypothetical protein